MGSNVLSSKQGRFTGAGGDVEILLEGLDCARFELLNETDLIQYKKSKLNDEGAACTVLANHDTAQLSRVAVDGDGITIEMTDTGAKITIAAAIAVTDKECQWFAIIN